MSLTTKIWLDIVLLIGMMAAVVYVNRRY